MKQTEHSTPRTLTLVWLALMCATGLTMISGRVTDISSIGWLWSSTLLIVTWLKARLILSYFLNLKSATRGWNQVFTFLVTVILLAVFGLYVVTELAVQL